MFRQMVHELFSDYVNTTVSQLCVRCNVTLTHFATYVLKLAIN
jgi:hypothetical protein